MIKRFFDWLDGPTLEGVPISKLLQTTYLEPEDLILISRPKANGYETLSITARDFAASLTMNFDPEEKPEHKHFSVVDMSNLAAKVLANRGKFKIKE